MERTNEWTSEQIVVGWELGVVAVHTAGEEVGWMVVGVLPNIGFSRPRLDLLSKRNNLT